MPDFKDIGQKILRKGRYERKFSQADMDKLADDMTKPVQAMASIVATFGYTVVISGNKDRNAYQVTARNNDSFSVVQAEDGRLTKALGKAFIMAAMDINKTIGHSSEEMSNTHKHLMGLLDKMRDDGDK